MLIGIINKSTIVSDDDCKKLVSAIDYQMHNHVSPGWGKLPCKVYFVSKSSFVPGSSNIVLVDNIDDPNAEGYHTENIDGKFVGNVGIRAIPGNVLTGPDSVSSVVSHEVIELYLDPAINLWADANDGYSYPYEGCDAVQESFYVVNGVSVSNFVLPNWFDNYATSHFDKMGKLSAPFTLASGGYTVRRKQGTGETQIFGKRPEWKNSIRSCKRV
jgi:hypothetical protein